VAKPRKAVARRRTSAKALEFTPQNAVYEFLPNSKINYAQEVANGMRSSVVTSALCWVMRTFPEAPLVVQRNAEQRWETQHGHALARLIRRPNPFYGGRVLWMCTVLDFCFGEAYWLKVRNGGNGLAELYWAPRGTITPKANPNSGALDYYEYRPGGSSAPKDLSPDDVVHFRFGLDPSNPLRGFSQLAGIMREVYTDDQASNFTAAVLKNLGIVGLVLSPKEGVIPKEQMDYLKQYVKDGFTGDKRAQAAIFSGAINAQLLQYNLQGFDVGPIRDISEERVCAALGIPAAVIGFGTGLQQTKVGATMREMVKLAWQGGIEPNQAIIADELDRALLPEFQANVDLFRTQFDTSEVEALTETPRERADRVAILVEANIIKVSQAQRELGYPVDMAQDKYIRELTAQSEPPVKPGGAAAQNRQEGDSSNAE